MTTGSKELIRDINSTLVLKMIINEGPISRAAIAKILGLTKATVSSIVQDLMDKHLVLETGSDNTLRGRKPILLMFCQTCGYTLSIDLGVDQISVLSSDLAGEHCQLKQYENHYDKTQIIEFLDHTIRSHAEQLPQSPYGIIGITLGIHGVVHNNTILLSPYYPYAAIPFKDELEQRLDLPIYLENEANLSILGEKTFYYNYSNLVGISIHTGVGLGLIIENKLFTGHNGLAGEFGHSIIEVDGRSCPCGNCGCFEQYASEQALLREYAKRKDMPAADFDSFTRAYQLKDKDAIYIMEEFVKYMAIGINNILNLYNPDAIIINSSFTLQYPAILHSIEARLQHRLHQYCRILPSGLQDASILLGGVCNSVTHFLNLDDVLFKK